MEDVMLAEESSKGANTRMPEVDAPAAKYLSKEDLLQINLLETERDNLELNKSMLEKDAAIASMSIEVAKLKARITELQVGHTMRGINERVAFLNEKSKDKTAEIEKLKKDLGEKYDIGNWDNVAYDVDTGRINMHP